MEKILDLIQDIVNERKGFKVEELLEEKGIIKKIPNSNIESIIKNDYDTQELKYYFGGNQEEWKNTYGETVQGLDYDNSIKVSELIKNSDLEELEKELKKIVESI